MEEISKTSRETSVIAFLFECRDREKKGTGEEGRQGVFRLRGGGASQLLPVTEVSQRGVCTSMTGARRCRVTRDERRMKSYDENEWTDGGGR